MILHAQESKKQPARGPDVRGSSDAPQPKACYREWALFSILGLPSIPGHHSTYD